MFLLSVTAAFGQPPKSRWAKFEGERVHYYDVGAKQNKALFLVHGWTCNADFWEESYSAFLSYQVIAIDLPGHGQRDKPHVDYSMAYFAPIYRYGHESRENKADGACWTQDGHARNPTILPAISAGSAGSHHCRRSSKAFRPKRTDVRNLTRRLCGLSSRGIVPNAIALY